MLTGKMLYIKKIILKNPIKTVKSMWLTLTLTNKSHKINNLEWLTKKLESLPVAQKL
jgi:hypothetical protein